MKNEQKTELEFVVKNYASYYDIEYLKAVALAFKFQLNI
jgi:hypothetical protein